MKTEEGKVSMSTLIEHGLVGPKRNILFENIEHRSVSRKGSSLILLH